MLYGTFGERLMTAALAAGLLVSLAGWQWANTTAARLQSPALNTGTYGGGWFAARLDDLDLRPTPETALLVGLAAQLDGDDSAARRRYAGAPGNACALNNLGVIAQTRGDEPQARELYRGALAQRPDLAAAAYNLGLNPSTPGTAFQRGERVGASRLCYPDDRSLARAVNGDLSVTLLRELGDPLAAVSPGLGQGGLGQGGLGQSVRLGWAFLGALLLLALLALSLLIPQAPGAGRQGRPAAYRLAALLLPGAALLDGAWGGVLLLAWGAALAGLTPRTGLTHPGTLPDLRTLPALLLLGTYALNVVALIGAELRLARQRRREAAQN